MTRRYIMIAMYQAMDCMYDEHPSEELLDFVTELNPYIWTSRTSADPAVEIEFNEFIDENFGRQSEFDQNQAYDIVKKYLENLNPAFAVIFSNITIEEWNNLCKIVEEDPINIPS